MRIKGRAKRRRERVIRVLPDWGRVEGVAVGFMVGTRLGLRVGAKVAVRTGVMTVVGRGDGVGEERLADWEAEKARSESAAKTTKDLVTVCQSPVRGS